MKKILYLLYVLSIFLLAECSTKYMYYELSDFSDATETIGNNIIYCFEKMQEEEMNLRVAQVIKENSIKPSDLVPRVLTFSHLETRKNLIKYLINYTRFLASIFKNEYRDEILKNAKTVHSNLEVINNNHSHFLSKKEMGIISTIAAALPEALTYSKKRQVVLNIMNQNQKLMEKIINKLKKEMEYSQIQINNFYARQFLLGVEEKWPEKESKREKYAKIGLKIIKNKNKINIIMTELIKGISTIPPAHKELIVSIRKHLTPLNALKDLINYSYRIKELYRDFTK